MQNSGRLLGLVVALAALGGARQARAADLPCETRTARSPADLVVSLGDESNPDLPAQAVKLLPGEVACITGELDPSGALQNLRVASGDVDATGVTIQLELEQGDHTQLVVRHSSDDRFLSYRALQIVTAQNLTQPIGTRRVAPRLRNLEQWGSGVRGVLLLDFRLFAPPRETEPFDVQLRKLPERRDTRVTNLSATFGFWVGERTLKLQQLEEQLKLEGFGPFSRVGLQGGMDLDFTFWRVRAGVALAAGGRSARNPATGQELGATLSEIGFTAGFDVLSYEQLRAFVGTGIVVESFYLDRPPGTALFPRLEPWEGDRVKHQGGAVPFDVGVEYFFPFARASSTEKWMLQLGTRIGWTEQLGAGEWTTDEQNGRTLSGPPLDLSGFRARLVVGIGAQNGWQR